MQAGSLIRVVAALAAAIGALALASPAGAASPNVVISQVYGGGGNSGAQYTNDFIELFNRGSAPADISTWSLQYTSATGTGNFGSAANLITPLSGVLEPGQHMLVEESGGTTGAPLPTPKATDATPINMSATGGKVALVNTQTPLGCNGGTTPCPPAALAQIVDLIGYDGANFYEGSAPAPALSNTTAAFRALAGCQDTDENSADFAADAPAPRTLLSPIVFCTPPTPHLAISQVYGGGGNSGATLRNDFIEVFNRGAVAVNLSGWSVQYAAASGTGAWTQTPLTNVTLQPGQYYLVQEAQGAGGTVDLPTPDAVGTTPMAAGAGKVALVNSTLPLNGACPTSSSIADLVGYGTANCSEGSPAPTLTNTTAGLRNNDGCVDTENNTADFTAGTPTPRNTASPFEDCNADTAPSVATTIPASNASDIAVGANVSITFSEPVNVQGSWYSISCGSSGSHTATVSGGPTTFTFDPDTDFALGESCTVTVTANGVTDQDANDPPDTMAADYVFTFTTQTAPIPIHVVQGATHISPYNGQVVKVLGVVTARSSNGFWMQDPSPDADPATSEAIFVFTTSTPTAVVGDSVRISGRVQEFRPGGATNGNLTTTELPSPTVTILSSGNPLPSPVVIGTGGRIPPDTVIEDDASGSVETSGVFDPAQDGLDFYESLEGMRVQLNDAVAVGPTEPDFGETPVIGDDGANASVRTYRGGLLLRPDDGNPERVTLDDLLTPLPDVNVGDHYSGPIVGIIDYNFGNPFIEVTSPGLTAIHDGVTRETTDLAGPGELTIATFNFENLAAGQTDKLTALAHLIVGNLRSPDLIAGEEVQDNNGTTDNGVVDASQTLTQLVSAIHAAGGPAYAWRQIDPVDDQDGGAPGGNIRQVFLFRTDRGLSFVDRPGGDPTTPNAVVGSGAATHLQYSPGRIDPASGAWASSRKPLAGEFDYRGHKLFMIANHFNSKGGDDPLRGRFQPPVQVTATQRHQQAHEVADFVSSISTADPNADVVVLGDLNDFEFSETVQILEGAGLHDLMDTLPLNQRYSYEFEGNAQVLDHVLFSGPLVARSLVFDPVHVNAEFFDQVSDHDPSVVRVLLNDPPSTSAGGPYAVDEGSTVTLTATGTDAEGGALSYAWDLDDNGSFETPGQSVAFSPDDGPSTPVVKVRVTDDIGLTSTAQVTVTVANVAPTVTALAASPLNGLVGQGVTFTGTATDASTADTNAGFSWAFDTGGGFGAFGPNGFVASFSACGTYTADAKARDKDGGVSAAFTSSPVHVYDGDVLPPLTPGAFNLVQRSQVVPVKISIGCNGFLGGLQPAISIRAGDYDPTVDPGDPSYLVPDTASSADTSGVMREGNQQYMYNLGVPSNGSAGQLYTVLIRPFGGSAPTLYAVLKIKR
jgi:predicted extracellular nuclease